MKPSSINEFSFSKQSISSCFLIGVGSRDLKLCTHNFRSLPCVVYAVFNRVRGRGLMGEGWHLLIWRILYSVHVTPGWRRLANWLACWCLAKIDSSFAMDCLVNVLILESCLRHRPAWAWTGFLVRKASLLPLLPITKNNRGNCSSDLWQPPLPNKIFTNTFPTLARSKVASSNSIWGRTRAEDLALSSSGEVDGWVGIIWIDDECQLLGCHHYTFYFL